MNEKEKIKRKKKKERDEKKEELKNLQKIFSHDEEGNKRSKTQINEMILGNLKSDFRKDTKKVVKQKSKFNYKVIKGKTIINGREVEQIIETDY